MRFHRALVLLTCAVVLCATIAQCVGADESTESGASIAERRSKLALPKIFDFGRFKSLFKRKYASFMEELAREKIFLGRAFRAFISFIKYKHNKSDKYLKISELSDWTEAEHDAILNRGGFKAINGDSATGMQNTPLATAEEIKAKLDHLAQNSEISEELRSSRRKREVSNGSRSSLKVGDLFSEPPQNEESDSVPSNNPDYIVPELTSFGSESDELPLAPMEESTLKGVLGGLFGGLFSRRNDDDELDNEVIEETKPAYYIRSSLPDEVFVDHRESGCLSAPKNQGQCGSCYIFSTTALFEWEFCHESGKKVAFSEQYPLDCGERIGMSGCKGGLEYTVAQFFGKYGLEMSKKYPYHHRSDACPYDARARESSMGYIKLRSPTGDFFRGIKHEYADKLLQKMPILYGLGVPADFSDYGGGVDHGYNCMPEKAHSMLLVGSGREDGHEYWLFRNSYGPTWGLNGHYKLNKKATNCLLDDGLGYFITKSPYSASLFDLRENVHYDSRYVDRRRLDLLTGAYVPSNPVNSDGKINMNPGDIVTPPPSRY